MRISDGALRFLAILATLYAPTTPPLVCIEEPELGLHPDALSLLAELLVGSVQQNATRRNDSFRWRCCQH